jgi:hypothetical protein
MPHVISSEPDAWIIRIPRPRLMAPSFTRRIIGLWWRGWQSIAADLGRRGIR